MPATQETQVRSLSWEDPLEKEMATHSSILAWRIPWTEEPGGLQSMGLKRVGYDTTERLHSFCVLYRLQALWKFRPVYRPKRKKERKKNHSPLRKKLLLFCAVMPPSTSTPHSLSQRDFSRISISISSPHLLVLSEMRRKKVKQSYLAFLMCGIFRN